MQTGHHHQSSSHPLPKILTPTLNSRDLQKGWKLKLSMHQLGSLGRYDMLEIRVTSDGQSVERRKHLGTFDCDTPAIAGRPWSNIQGGQIVPRSNGILLRARRAGREELGSQGRVNHCYWLPRTLAKNKLTSPRDTLVRNCNEPTFRAGQSKLDHLWYLNRLERFTLECRIW